jgi:hypothetical protein
MSHERVYYPRIRLFPVLGYIGGQRFKQFLSTQKKHKTRLRSSVWHLLQRVFSSEFDYRAGSFACVNRYPWIIAAVAMEEQGMVRAKVV